MPTDSYDRDLIAPLEAQGDWDAQVEAELDRLQALPLQELIDELTGAEWTRCHSAISDRIEARPDRLAIDEQIWLRQYIVDTFGNRIATDRLHGREGR